MYYFKNDYPDGPPAAKKFSKEDLFEKLIAGFDKLIDKVKTKAPKKSDK